MVRLINVLAIISLVIFSACKSGSPEEAFTDTVENPAPAPKASEAPAKKESARADQVEIKKKEISHTIGLPDGAHPRIWLTSDEMSRLTSKRDKLDAEWTKLLSWCDKHLEDRGYNADPPNLEKSDLTGWSGDGLYHEYRMSGFYFHLMNYSLAYRILMAEGSGRNTAKASLYAARVRALLIEGIAEHLRAGEEPNGLKALRVADLKDVTINSAEAAELGILKGKYKLGYSSRFLAAVPIAYDWIYETLSEQDKAVLIAMMLRWYDWIQGVRTSYNNGVLIKGKRYHETPIGDCSGIHNCTDITGPQSLGFDFGNMSGNFMGGHVYLMSMIAIAVYGENSDTPAYFANFQSLLDKTVIDNYESDFKHGGGDSVEGWNYGGGFQFSLLGLYGYHTATGDTKISNLRWPTALIDAMIHRVGANLSEIPYYGYWTGTPLGKARMGMILPMVGVEQRLRPGSSQSKVGQYFLHNVKYEDKVDEWKMMLWHDKSIPEAAPTELPLHYAAKGNGYFTSKSSWTDPNGTLVGLRLEGKFSAHHEGYDEGDISLMRGTDRLLTHQNSVGDAAPAVSYNTIVFNQMNHQALNPAVSKTAIDRMDSGPGYAYVSGDISNGWKRILKPDTAKLFRRSVLHLHSGMAVVYDVTQSNPAFGNRKDWYTQYVSVPTINGHTISATVGNSNVFVKTLYPTGGTFTATSLSEGYYRVNYTPNAEQESEQFLHLISATDKSVVEPASSDLISSGNARGVHIKDAGENSIALFTTSASGASIAGEIKYTFSPTAPKTTHYIADLIPGQRYDLTVMGVGSLSVTVMPSAKGRYQASSGGLLVVKTEAN